MANRGTALVRISASLLVLRFCASALNPSFDVSQYAHTAWKSRDGFPKGAVHAIAQTKDGYLWLGTEFGLVRFDGARPTPWQPPANQPLPSDSIVGLLAARDDTLWIGTWKGLASWKNGKLTQYSEFAGLVVVAIVEDREGTVWAGGFGPAPPGKLCAIHNGTVRCYGADSSFGNGVVGLYGDRKRNLWAGTLTGVWRWKPSPPEFYPLAGEPHGIQGIAEDDSGVLIGLTGRAVRFVRGKPETAYRYQGPARNSVGWKFLRERDGGLWIGSSGGGLIHAHLGRTDTFSAINGLSGDLVTALFEDREGDVWAATTNGLDRFRLYAVVTLSAEQHLGSVEEGSVLAARDGSIWVDTSDGLSRWKNGQVSVLPGAKRGTSNEILSLFQDHEGRIWVAAFDRMGYFENDRFVRTWAVPPGVTFSMTEERVGCLSIASLDRGLLQVRDGRFLQQIPWATLGHKDNALALAADPLHGLWLGFAEGGLAYLKDGQLRGSYGAADGLGKGAVSGIQFDNEGTLWAATAGGLSRLKDGRIATLTSKNGLPCDAVHWSVEDDNHDVWLYMPCGLVRIARAELDGWSSNPRHNIRVTVFDNTDGLRSRGSAPRANPNVAKSPDGKIWFSTAGGLSVFDPRHIPFNKLPPPVNIEQITADRKAFDATRGQRLPALTRDLEIDYTALSLVAPEKNRFKYKLEGYDRDWIDAGSRRQAFYTNLAPRGYTFRVKASNNSGVWNEAGASLNFSVDPAYYQTIWFQALCAAVFASLLWALYRYRVRQIERECNMRLEERVGERTRIARDFHDTLLQSFQGLLLEFQAARNLFSRRPDDAMRSLDDAISSAEAAIAEGRDAIHGLRSGSEVGSDLANLLTAAGQELSEAEASNGSGTAFHLTVEGSPRTLSTILQDEIYRMGRELVRNAFCHARAKRIEVEVRYDDRMLRLRIRDDGIGVDPKLLEQGARTGHWGLPGVRERAKLIGARMDFWSEAGAGTEVQIRVPGSIAYQKSRDGRRFGLLRK
jgi:signal transduction histidine kinase/ligand-binding sensor domain-containing protein